MRIDRLQIDGFGAFFQREVGPFEGTVSIIFGANEAGKSTLMAFIRTVLFGFPSRGSDSHYPPLAGGRHGGRLVFVADDGQSYHVQRYRGPHGGQVVVTAADGSQHDGSTLSRLLDHTHRDLFENVFAFSLDELQDDRSLEGGEISDRIYSAGIGAAGLPAALRELEAAQGKIFTPRGRKPEIAKVLAELRQVENDLSDVSAQAAEYGRLSESRREIERGLSAAGLNREELRLRMRELDRLKNGWAQWGPILDIDRDLAGLPPFENFPDSAIVRLENYEKQAGDADQTLAEAEEDLRRASEAADVQVNDELLLEQSQAIKSMQQGFDFYVKSVEDLPQREADLEGLETTLNAGLRDLGPRWDESRLEGFDTSVALRDQVEQWRKRLDEAEQTARDRAIELKQHSAVLRDALGAEGDARDQVEGTPGATLDAAEIDRRRGALRTARTHLVEVGRTRDRREGLEAQVAQATPPPEEAARPGGQWPVLPGLVAIAGLAALVIGLVVDGQVVALGLGISMLLIGAAAWWIQWVGRNPAGASAPVESSALWQLAQKAKDAENSARSDLQSSATALEIKLPDAASLDAVETRLDAETATLSTWDAVTEALDVAANSLYGCRRRRDDAEEGLAEASEQRNSSQSEWSEWLEGRQLPGSLTPIAVGQMLERIETVRANRKQVTEMRKRIDLIRRNMERYRDIVEPVAASFLPSVPAGDASRIAATADELIARFDAAREEVAKRDSGKEAEESQRRNVERDQRRLASLQEGLEALISSGGASDAEDLRRRDSQHAKRVELEERRRDHSNRLQQLCLPNETQDDLTETLDRTTPESIIGEQARLESELEQEEERKSELDKEKGRIESSLERLTKDEESSALRARKEVLVERLHANAREWSKLAIARAILQRARQKYERERQPGVMRHAERFFKRVTGERYTRLFAPLGEHTVTVAARDGVSKQPSELSRGTREQLYLALRFGLIREFGDHSEHLPVIVDEVLVNFDPQRGLRAAETFVEMAQTNQVLVFTCHPATVDLFKSVAPDVQVIDLDANVSGPRSDPQARLI